MAGMRGVTLLKRFPMKHATDEGRESIVDIQVTHLDGR